MCRKDPQLGNKDQPLGKVEATLAIRDEPAVGFETLSAGLSPPGSPAVIDQTPAPATAPACSQLSTVPTPRPELLPAPAAGGRPGDIVEVVRETPDALTPERLLKRHARIPDSGWRRAAYKLTAGAWNPGESAEELERRRLEALATARCTEVTRFVPVLARKGGVGKTTAATLLGMTMAKLRHDRIVALDANPDRGTLADRTPRQTTATVWDVVHSADSVASFADMSRLVSRDVTRLDVIASETEPSRARAFGADDYKSVAELLRRYYSVVITDCGTDFTHDVIPAILDYADAVVVVAGASVDEARLASETLDMIAALGHPELAANAVVAVQSASQSPVNLAEVTKHFNSRARGVVRIPRDPHLAE
ncbi:MAG: MinD/ParA family protein, partial [Longispora sp.]|nr:MinD/ParA family protein [Longispora sp. (in: high G+C Gram-positive bacteria)]